MTTPLHRKPRGGGGGALSELADISSRSSSNNEKARRPKKLAPAHAAPLKQPRRMSTTQLRALCVACLLVYLGALCFAEDIVRLGAAVRSVATRQQIFSPWRPVRSAVTAVTRPLLRGAPAPTVEPDDDAAEDDNARAAARTAAARDTAEPSVALSTEVAEQEEEAAGTVPPTPAAAVPAELERADLDVVQQNERERDAETTEEDAPEDNSAVVVLDMAEGEEAAKAAETSKTAGVASAEELEADGLRNAPTPAAVAKQDPTTSKLADERRSPPVHESPSTTDTALQPLGERRSPPNETDRADQDAVELATTTPAAAAATADVSAALSRLPDAPDAAAPVAPAVHATAADSTAEKRQTAATENADRAPSEPMSR